MEGNIQYRKKIKKEEFSNLGLELLGIPLNLIIDYGLAQIGILCLLALPYTTNLFGKIILIEIAIICLGVVIFSIPGYIDTIKKLIKAHKIAHNKI